MRATAAKCPLCGGRVDPWIGVPRAEVEATVGLPSPVNPDDPGTNDSARLFDRCAKCGAGIERSIEPIDFARELERLEVEGVRGVRSFEAPNRASWQAGLAGDGWSVLSRWEGRFLLTPRALALLAEKNGLETETPAYPPWGVNQRWIWQSFLNGITLHPNFASEVRGGRLRLRNARSTVAYAADAVASLLATPLVLLVSVPVEAIAALFNRGGRMIVRARPASQAGGGELGDKRRELAGAGNVG
jgi:hypothetical protein